MKYIWIEESPNTASDAAEEGKPKNRPCERPNGKEKQLRHHRKGRRTLPKARAGIGVEKK